MIRFDRSGMRAGFGRDLVLDLLERGFTAIDPRRVLTEALVRNGDRLRVGGTDFDLSTRRVWTIAIGKAARPPPSGSVRRRREGSPSHATATAVS
jgi:glycerate-2-kinase